jgi:dephospho-CoA kinase
MGVSVIFVTGLIGSGKSLFTKCLAELGAHAIDADKIVSELYVNNPIMVGQIEAALGVSIRDRSGSVDKKLVANKIFSDDTLRKAIERIIHPLVRARMQEIVAENSQVYVYEIPVITSDTDLSLASKIVVVEAPESLRKERLIARGMEVADIDARMGSQARNSFSIESAIHISNSGSIEDLQSVAKSLYNQVQND